MKKKIYSCPECGSSNVMYDAYVMMNDDEDVRTFDDKVCDDCSAHFDTAVETDVDDVLLPIDVAVPDPEPVSLARDLAHYFDTWELVLPADAREALRPLAEAARRS